MIETKNKRCIKCKEPLDNCIDEDMVIIGDLKHLAHKRCISPFDNDNY